MPGPTALLAPQWVPWEQRVKPGDLSPGDLLAPPADDPRLVPGYLLSGDPEVDEIAAEIGLGRRQVLERLGPRRGRAALARRRLRSGLGDGAVDQAGLPRLRFLAAAGRDRSARCSGCAATSWPPTGTSSTSVYGCGAHSDTPAPAGSGSPLYEPYDDGVLDVIAAASPPEPPRSQWPQSQSSTQWHRWHATICRSLLAESVAEEPVAEQSSRPRQPRKRRRVRCRSPDPAEQLVIGRTDAVDADASVDVAELGQ